MGRGRHRRRPPRRSLTWAASPSAPGCVSVTQREAVGAAREGVGPGLPELGPRWRLGRPLSTPAREKRVGRGPGPRSSQPRPARLAPILAA